MKRISSLLQKLHRMDFLIVWDSQVLSPLGVSLVVTSRRTLAASFLAELSVLTQWCPQWWGQMSQGSAFLAGLNRFESPASAVKLLFLQAVL